MSSEPPPLPLSPGNQGNILGSIAIGILDVVNNYVITQPRLGFAEVAEWSPPLLTANAGEMMRILTKPIGNRLS